MCVCKCLTHAPSLTLSSNNFNLLHSLSPLTDTKGKRQYNGDNTKYSSDSERKI